MHKKNRIDYDGQKYKARGHCHFTGKYRGAADNTQNLKYKDIKYQKKFMQYFTMVLNMTVIL